jgi:hypothetical protein
MRSSPSFGGLLAIFVLFGAGVAHASPEDEQEVPRSWPSHASDEVSGEKAPTAPPPRDVRREVPIVAFTYNAAGVSAKSVGAQGYALGLAASGQDAVLGGGATVWGSPIQRLTLIADAQRNVWGNFSPSAAVLVRLLGEGNDGWCLGALGKFKVDGFASGPNHDEVESEVELGALVSFARFGWHLDVNSIMGRGTGDDGETDAEARLRFSRDLGRYIRLGLDGQTRFRLAGPKYLPNGRTWDFAAGPQVLVGSDHFYGSFTTGPSTMGLTSDSVGATALLAFGGTT